VVDKLHNFEFDCLNGQEKSPDEEEIDTDSDDEEEIDSDSDDDIDCD
jgi:hypothetical protein